MTATKKRIIICADDFGLSKSISRAVISLFKTDRISATSCMTTSCRWHEDALLLEPFHDRKDIGLHMNLTEGTPLSANPLARHKRTFSGLPELLARSLVHQIDATLVKRELHAQLDAFESITGRLPDFIDGHQHIHHLPVIREIVLDLYRQRLEKHPCYIRSVYPVIPWKEPLFSKQRIKKWVITMTGARKMKGLIRQHSISSNMFFGGIYDFSKVEKFPKMIEEWLQVAPDGTLLMCHPGKEQDEHDPLQYSRKKEYEWLQSDGFIHLCNRENIKVTRFHS